MVTIIVTVADIIKTVLYSLFNLLFPTLGFDDTCNHNHLHKSSQHKRCVLASLFVFLLLVDSLSFHSNLAQTYSAVVTNIVISWILTSATACAGIIIHHFTYIEVAYNKRLCNGNPLSYNHNWTSGMMHDLKRDTAKE